MSTITLHITGLAPGESDTWTVTSVDATGLESAPSTGLVVQMLVAITLPPQTSTVTQSVKVNLH